MSTILFDLDGTLTESAPGITRAAAYALSKFGISVSDPTTLNFFVGPPLLDTFREIYDFSEADAKTAVVYYRDYYSTRGLFENAPYEGIPALLSRLNAEGHTLMVATSKPEHFTHQILERFSLSSYFSDVVGSTKDESRSQKWDVIAYLLSRHPELNGQNTVMVGDRWHDVEGAHKNKLPAVGVLYGYGSREELEQAGADRIAESVSDLLSILQGGVL